MNKKSRMVDDVAGIAAAGRHGGAGAGPGKSPGKSPGRQQGLLSDEGDDEARGGGGPTVQQVCVCTRAHSGCWCVCGGGAIVAREPLYRVCSLSFPLCPGSVRRPVR
jgi:hypothetical protein